MTEEKINISPSPRASSGYSEDSFRTGYAVRMEWSRTSQSTKSNTTTIEARVYLVSKGSAYTIVSSSTKKGSITVDGTTKSFSFSAGLSGNQKKLIYSTSFTISHKSDGTKTFSYSGTLGLNVTLSGKYWRNVSTSGSGTLDTIPRTSSFSINKSSMDFGQTVRVTINKASSSFRQIVRYKFSDINVVKLDSSSATTVDIVPSLGDMGKIPSSTSGTATIVVETWSGSTKIGETSKTMTLTVPSSIKPTLGSLTATVVADGASTSFGYVQGKSKATITMNSVGTSYSSPIKSYHISGAGFTGTSSTLTTGKLSASGDFTFSAYVIDSRGRKSDTKTCKITVQPYSSPRFSSATATRCTSSGSISDSGTYIKAIASFAVGTTLGGKNSIASATVRYRQTGGSLSSSTSISSNTTGVIIGSGTISTSKTYEAVIEIRDSVGVTETRVIQVGSEFVTLDLKYGGRGIAIGKAATTDDMFEVAMRGKFLKGVVSTASYNGKTAPSSVPDGYSLIETSIDAGTSGFPLQYGTNATFKVNNARMFQLFHQNVGTGFYVRNSHPDATGGTATDYSPWYRVYTTGYKPSASDVGALPIGGGTVTGTTVFRGGSNLHTLIVSTKEDSNGVGDGHTHLGYYYNGKYSHYFRGKGATYIDTLEGAYISKGLEVAQGINSGWSIKIGSYVDSWRSVTLMRNTEGIGNYEARYAITHNTMKITSTSPSTKYYGAVIEAHNGKDAVRRYLFSNAVMAPLSDNDTYLGCSSHRWQAAYCTTGKFYASTKSLKTNIHYLEEDNIFEEDVAIARFGDVRRERKTTKDYVLDAIKSTPMAVYNYKSRMLTNEKSRSVTENQMFLGFIADDLKANHPEFFDLIGECAVHEKEVLDEEGKPTGETYEETQYDISDISVLGALWTGLQESLRENDRLKARLELIEKQLGIGLE